MSPMRHPPLPQHRPDINDPIWVDGQVYLVVRFIAPKENGAFAVELNDSELTRHIVKWTTHGWVSILSWNIDAKRR